MIKSTTWFLQLIGFLLLLGLPATAGDFYVNPSTGKDQASWGASASKPWKTIHYALKQLLVISKGDSTLHLAAGTYTEAVSLSASPVGPSYPRITLAGAGSSKTLLKGSVQASGGGKMTLKTLSCPDVSFLPYRGQDCVVLDCTIGKLSMRNIPTGSLRATILRSKLSSTNLLFGDTGKAKVQIADSRFGSGGLSIFGTINNTQSEVTIERCLFESSATDALTLHMEGSSATIRDCRLLGAKGYGIRIDSSVDMATTSNHIGIQDCVVFECSAGGIHAKNTDRHSWPTFMNHLTVAQTIVLGCGRGVEVLDWDLDLIGSSIQACNSDALTLQANLHKMPLQKPAWKILQTRIWDNGGAGLLFLASPAASCTVTNTMVCRNALGIAGSPGNQLTSLRVESCTIADNKGSPFALVTSQGKALSITHAVFSGNGAKVNAPAGTTIDHCLSDLQVLTGVGNFKGRALFASASRGMYRLSIQSPAIDAGLAKNLTSSVDFEGDPRVIAAKSTGARPDLGADEWSLQGLPHPFLAPDLPIGMPRCQWKLSTPVKIGGRLRAQLSPVRPNNGVLWLMGFSERRLSASIRLPLELSFLQAPGVLLYTSLDAVLLGARTTSGDALLDIPLPRHSSMIGLALTYQTLIMGSEGLGSSAPVRLVIGN